jgi:MSHA pilin protein MshC
MHHPTASLRLMQGFTMVELVIVIVLLGILSVTVLPRLTGSSEFRTVQLRDEVAAALRFAQKTAVSHRRNVCISVAGDVLALQIADAHPANGCNQALNIPGGAATVSVPGVSLSVTPAALVVQPSGQVIGNNSQKYEFSIGGGEYKLTLWAETGHVE